MIEQRKELERHDGILAAKMYLRDKNKQNDFIGGIKIFLILASICLLIGIGMMFQAKYFF